MSCGGDGPLVHAHGHAHVRGRKWSGHSHVHRSDRA